MKKVFEDDGSYIEIVKSKTPDHILISLCAKDAEKPDHVIMVSSEIHKDELLSIITEATKVLEEI